MGIHDNLACGLKSRSSEECAVGMLLFYSVGEEERFRFYHWWIFYSGASVFGTLDLNCEQITRYRYKI